MHLWICTLLETFSGLWICRKNNLITKTGIMVPLKAIVQQIQHLTTAIEHGTNVVWNIATLRYLYAFMLSNPIQFFFMWPVLVPLAMCAACITVTTVMITAVITCSVLFVVAIPLSGPLMCLGFMLLSCYLVYTAFLAVVNYIHMKYISAVNKVLRVKYIVANLHQYILSKLNDMEERATQRLYDEYLQLVDNAPDFVKGRLQEFGYKLITY